MGRYDRSIKIAFDKVSEKILEADKIFGNKIDAFEIRKKYHEKEVLFSCCECDQDLIVSGSKYDRLHFKHKPGHSYCILADERLTPQEHELFTLILRAKESDRHKELKNQIGEKLKFVDGVDINSISIDNTFIIKENGKRRPDVYCKFHDKEIVFEIQLSDLSLSYILNRYEFYREHGIYLIWVLDNFDIHNQGTLERDIKYLTKYHNFFKLDEHSKSFRLECEFKYPFLTENNKLLTKWIKKSVSLEELKYDNKTFQAYHYDFENNKIRIEAIQQRKVQEFKESERKRFEERRLARAVTRALEFKKSVSNLRESKRGDFGSVINELEGMDEFEIKTLNEVLNLKGKIIKGKTPLVTWIEGAQGKDVSFLEFILGADKIELDISGSDNLGRTALQAVLLNDNIPKGLVISLLFKARYELNTSDYKFFEEYQKTRNDFTSNIHLYKLCNSLTDRSLVNDVFKFSKLLLIIESARIREIIHYNYTGNKWISFANNAIQFYGEYWEYLELSFKRFGLWNEIINLDKNGKFQKKVEDFYWSMPIQKYDFDKVFHDLYPEVIYSN